MRKALLVAALLQGLPACGASDRVDVVRMGYAPGRPEACELEVVNVPASDLGPQNTEYEMLGTLVVRSRAAQNADPFSLERLASIRAQACGLGGDTLTLMMETGGMASYAVLRKKPGAAAAPSAAAPTSAAPNTP